MKRKSIISRTAYLTIALCICAGLICYNPSTEIVERKEFTDIVEGKESIIEFPKEEVPLGAPEVKTRTTVKKTTKRVTMAKKASKTTSKKTTKTKRSTKVSNYTSKKVVKVTTVTTTTLTSTRKKSRIKTIKTTVKTVVKTTTTILNGTENNKTPTNTAFTANQFSDVEGRVDQRVYEAFNRLDFKYEIDPSLSTAGIFSVRNRWIKLKVPNGLYLLHELGHFVAALEDEADGTGEWKNIYAREKDNYVGSNKVYVTSSASEYFAESFRDYTVTPATLRTQRPRTYDYMLRVVNGIDVDTDCSRFYGYYGWYWEMAGK